MAEANNDWADMNDELDQNPLLIDDETDPENAAADENVDPNIPAANKDQKQAKRRGRPPKQRNNSENAVNDGETAKSRELILLREELEQSKKQNLDLKSRLKKTESILGGLEEELDTTRGLLMEREQDYEKLLMEFSNQAETVEKPKGLVIHDSISKSIACKIDCNNIEWQTEQMNLENLNELRDDLIVNQEFDVIIIISGTADLVNGRTVSQAFTDLRNALERLCPHCEVFVTAIPPNMGKSVQVSLYNHKISQLQASNLPAQIINIPPKGLRSTMLKEDGLSLSDRCVEAYLEEIASNTKSVVRKQKSCKATQFEVKAVIPLKSEMFGRVIGKGGNVIKRITEENSVTMSLGKWSDSNTKGKDEPAFDGVMISGLSGNVHKAMCKVNEIVNKDSEPSEKKRKI